MDTTTTTGPARVSAGRREWVGLVALALPSLLVSIDVFVMLLALPHVSADLSASGTEQLWIMDVYGFMIAGFLITMGNLGDRIGRRRLLLIGAAAFGAASVLAAWSTTPEMLIAARALLGIAGATLAPSTLALISNMFGDPKQRSLAIGVWLVCFMSGAAVGPLVGGVMLEHFWWGSAFLLGVPAMLLLLVVGPVLLPEYRNADAGRLDLTSVALSLAAILPVVYGLKELAAHGWDATPVYAVVVGAAFGVVFVRRQRTLDDPLLDLRLFSRGPFTAALSGMLVTTLTMGALMVFIAQYLQLVQGLSPLRAGLWMLPAVGASVVSFLFAPLLARRIRPGYLVGGGLAVSVCGLLLVTQADASGGLAVLVTGFVTINLGAGPIVTLGTDLVVGSVPPEKAGSAAAMNETAGEFGFALGIASLGSLGTAVYRARFDDSVPAGVPGDTVEAAREGLAGAVAAADQLPAGAAADRTVAALLDAAEAAFTSGMHVVAGLSAVAVAVFAVVAVVLLRHVRPSGEAPPPPPSTGEASDRTLSHQDCSRPMSDVGRGRT